MRDISGKPRDCGRKRECQASTDMGEEFGKLFAKLDPAGGDRVNEPGRDRVNTTCALENVVVLGKSSLQYWQGKRAGGGLQMAGALYLILLTRGVSGMPVQGLLLDFQPSVSTESLDDAREYFREERTAVYFNGIWECEEFKGCGPRQILRPPTIHQIGRSLSTSPSSGLMSLEPSYDERRRKRASIRFKVYAQ